jgi:hypothetical protein
MQDDEREDRDMLPDDPDRREQPAPDEEFEAPAWPSQDVAAEPEAPQPPAEPEPPAQPEPRLEPEPPEPPAAPPPPAEVEAYGTDATATTAMAAHSVPATEPGESTRCPRCGTENRPGIAFCSNCGQRLVAAGAPTTVARPAAPEGTQACPRCGTHNRAGVAFCQNCGANLQGDRAAAVATPEPQTVTVQRRALLGPIVLLVGAVGIALGWLLPFALGTGSLYDRAFGDPAGYGIAFWNGYSQVSGLASQAYFGFAAPAPILVVVLVLLAGAGVLRATPGIGQTVGLIIALIWAIGLVALFLVVEVFGGSGSDLIGVLRELSPAGIIFALAGLIVVIGCLTRFGRS